MEELILSMIGKTFTIDNNEIYVEDAYRLDDTMIVNIITYKKSIVKRLIINNVVIDKNGYVISNF